MQILPRLETHHKFRINVNIYFDHVAKKQKKRKHNNNIRLKGEIKLLKTTVRVNQFYMAHYHNVLQEVTFQHMLEISLL